MKHTGSMPSRNTNDSKGYPRTAAKAEPQPKKKKGGCLPKLIAVLLVPVILFTGFVDPGFFKGKPVINVTNTTTGSSDNTGSVVESENAPDNVVPGDLSGFGNSKEIAMSPCDGVFVSAPKDAFLQDTEIRIQPVTEADETLLNTVAELEKERVRAIAGFEVDAGLEDDEVIPGTYTVSIDLDKLNVDESLYDHLVAYRVADDGTYYQYASRVENGKLIYSTDQNSITVVAVVEVGALIVFGTIMVAMWAKNISEGLSGPIQYFQDTKTKESKITRTNDYATYTLRWLNKDIGVDDTDIRNQMKAIEDTYRAKADELYKEYEKTKYDNASSILNIFSRNKSVEEVLAEAIKKDPDYQKLAKEMALPEPVEYAVACIDLSFKFLKEHEYIKMPSAVVEITSAPGLPSNAMALSMPRLPKYPWVHIDLSRIVNSAQEKKDALLVTLTHELLHVCQRGYRYFWTDSVRYDEMTAVVVENRAADWYKWKGIIDEDSTMEMCPMDYWGTLKLPLDKFYAEGKDKDDTTIMQHEGYNLGLFVNYLVEKTGRTMWGDRLMREACSYKEGGVSKPLMKAFGLNENEFETQYKLWIRKNKQKFSDYYNAKEESYKANSPIIIKKGEKYSVPVVPEGSYTSEIRGFQQKTQDPMILLLIPDGGFSSKLPGTQLLPVDSFERFTKGAYIPALDRRTLVASKNNRNILEITGVLNNPGDTSGYTVYVLDKTKPAACREDDTDLIMEFPNLSKAAAAKIIDGYLLTIDIPGREKIKIEISNAFFEDEYRIPKEELFKGSDEDSLTLTLTLCEYVTDSSGKKLMGEISDEFIFEINNKGNNPQTSGRWVQTQTNVYKTDNGEQLFAHSKKYWSYDASAASHTVSFVSYYVDDSNNVDKNRIVEKGTGTVTCDSPPRVLVPGQTYSLSGTSNIKDYSLEKIWFNEEIFYSSSGIYTGARLKNPQNVAYGKMLAFARISPQSGTYEYDGSGTYEWTMYAGDPGLVFAVYFYGNGAVTEWLYEWSSGQ